MVKYLGRWALPGRTKMAGGAASVGAGHVDSKKLNRIVRQMSQFHDDDAKIGEATGSPLQRHVPTGWTAIRVGVEGEGTCGLHSVNYIMNTRGYRTLLHEGCPMDQPCPHTPPQQRKLLSAHQNPRVHRKPVATHLLRRISEDTRLLLSQSFTPTSAQCALRCFYEKHCPNRDVQDDIAAENFTEIAGILENMYRWLTEIAFRQLSTYFDVDIVIYDHTSREFYCGFRGDRPGSQPLMFVNWIDHRHFEPIVFVHDLPAKLKECGGRMETVLQRHAYGCVPRPRQVDTDEDKSVCALYRSLYKARASVCAGELKSNAFCRSNRSLPQELPPSKEL